MRQTLLGIGWAVPGVFLLTCSPASAEDANLVYSQASLAKARDACKDAKFVSTRIKLVFGPPAAQNPNIETVVLRIERNAQGKPTKVIISLVIAGTDPPVPAPFYVLTPDNPDFQEIAMRLLLEK